MRKQVHFVQFYNNLFSYSLYTSVLLRQLSYVCLQTSILYLRCTHFLHDKYLQQHFYILLYIVSITAVVGMFSFLISVYCVVANIYCYIIVSCGLLLFVFLMFIELSYSCVMFMFW